MAARQSLAAGRGARAVHALGLCSALHASTALAEVHPQAAPILEKLVAATGGSEARANERTLRLKGRIEAIGLSGRWEMWLAAPDRWTRHFTLGSLRFREGYDGEVAWRTDLSGKTVTIQAASELEDAREQGWFLNERWALADPVGQPRRFYVSGKTGFIERMTHEVDQHTVEEHPRNYKTLGGRKRRSIYQSPTLLPTDKPIERMTVDSVWVNPVIDPARFSPPDVAARRIDFEHQVYAGTVITGSAGYEAGLRWYDEIVSIDGRPALKWTREELDRVLEEGEVGSVHRITYRRWLEDEDKTVEVKLRDVL